MILVLCKSIHRARARQLSRASPFLSKSFKCSWPQPTVSHILIKRLFRKPKYIANCSSLVISPGNRTAIALACVAESPRFLCPWASLVRLVLGFEGSNFHTRHGAGDVSDFLRRYRGGFDDCLCCGVAFHVFNGKELLFKDLDCLESRVPY